MANPQCEDGYTRIANEILEHGLAKINLSAYEYRILAVLWRKTYGFGKTEDTISVTQFERATGIKRRHVKKTLDSLVTKNIVFKDRKSYISTYGFNKDYESWKAIQDNKTITYKGNTLTEKTITSLGNTLLPIKVTELLPIKVPTKEKRNYTKEIHTFSQTENSGKGRENTFNQDAIDILSSYPKIVARDTSLKSIVKLLKKGVTKESLLQAVSNYKQQIKSKGIEEQYILQSNNFFGRDARYKDYINSPEKKLSPVELAIQRCKERGDY